MFSKFFYLFVVSALVFSIPAQPGDAEVVRTILTENGLSWDLNTVATFESGRVIALALNNQDFGSDGIKTLPASIGELTELKKLTLNDNSLTAVPPELFKCKKLTDLEIANNTLTSLPAAIGNLSHVRLLDLRNNQLDNLPPAIGQLKALVKLQLWGNKFVSLPSEIGGLTALQELYLKGNRLTNLPVSITRLSLKYLDVLDNKLCGLQGPVDAWLKKFDKKYESLQKCLGNDKRFQ
jgi:Leucine-rich repeat (LRR) protein